jgi:DNA-binding LacI/PurR family transcriptional regulator
MPSSIRKASRRTARASKAVKAAIELQPAQGVTSYDVAKLARVSQSAVSRCFMPGASASAKMRERVMRAARELGYSPNAIARSLITKRSNLVAILISNLTNLYYPEVLSEITRHLSAAGVRALLFTLEHESDADAVLEQVWQYRVDGVIAAARLSTVQVDEFARRATPLVFYNRFLSDKAVSAVCCEQYDGAQLLVSRLAAAGHRRFGIISGPRDSVVGRERTRGAIERLRELKLRAPVVVGGQYDYESGRAGLREIVAKRGAPPDAVVCGNDVMAIGCIDVARHELKLQVPKQISVVGFDGVAPSTWASYRLTTMRQPVLQMAQAAVTMLLGRIGQPDTPPEKRLFPAQLIEGASARLG